MEIRYVEGIFKQEIKNRFLCDVDIDGEETICYIPSSCRLSNFMDMKNRKVILKPIENPNARTKFAVYAVEFGRKFILINLAEANRVIEKQISKRLFSFLGHRKKVLREKKIGEYKSDLFIEDTKTIIEVKCILSFEKTAGFPTVYSERAVKQLKSILELLKEGYRVCYVMVSLNPDVENIIINREIDDYYQLFRTCVDNGMTYAGISIKLVENEPIIQKCINMSI